MSSNDNVTSSSSISNVNQHLFSLEGDYFYHLSMGKNENDLKAMFGDVKFVCMGGQSSRMQKFAYYMKDLLGVPLPVGMALDDITKITDRYSMYKVGPVLFVNHGIGCPSLSILLNEVLKVLMYAECRGVTFFRIGTCGGVGVVPGTVVVSEQSVDGLFRAEYRQIILGKEVTRPTNCDKALVDELLALSQNTTFQVVSGKTLCVNDFYEDQARLDGIFCNYTKDDKIAFLTKCRNHGIVNIEMESLCFAGMLNQANVKFAIVCVTLLDRLERDVVHGYTVKEFQERPFEIVGQYIKNKLAELNLLPTKTS